MAWPMGPHQKRPMRLGTAMATISGSGPVAGEPSAPVPAGFWNCMAMMPAKEQRQPKMTSFLAPLSDVHVANRRQTSAIVTCITPRMEAVCVTRRKSSVGSVAFLHGRRRWDERLFEGTSPRRHQSRRSLSSASQWALIPGPQGRKEGHLELRAVAGRAAMLRDRGMKSVVHEKPIAVRLPSSEKM